MALQTNTIIKIGDELLAKISPYVEMTDGVFALWLLCRAACEDLLCQFAVV